jgi:hypothetical protein
MIYYYVPMASSVGQVIAWARDHGQAIGLIHPWWTAQNWWPALLDADIHEEIGVMSSIFNKRNDIVIAEDWMYGFTILYT